MRELLCTNTLAENPNRARAQKMPSWSPKTKAKVCNSWLTCEYFPLEKSYFAYYMLHCQMNWPRGLASSIKTYLMFLFTFREILGAALVIAESKSDHKGHQPWLPMLGHMLQRAQGPTTEELELPSIAVSWSVEATRNLGDTSRILPRIVLL